MSVNDYTWGISRILKNVESIEVLYAEIPNSYYNIPEGSALSLALQVVVTTVWSGTVIEGRLDGEGIVGLFRICAAPDVAAQSEFTWLMDSCCWTVLNRFGTPVVATSKSGTSVLGRSSSLPPRRWS